jgi:hypothetical protein
MHKNAMKCNKIQSKWCINKHGASKTIDTFERRIIRKDETEANLAVGDIATGEVCLAVGEVRLAAGEVSLAAGEVCLAA